MVIVFVRIVLVYATILGNGEKTVVFADTCVDDVDGDGDGAGMGGGIPDPCCSVT
jgi:hypothetical protein